MNTEIDPRCEGCDCLTKDGKCFSDGNVYAAEFGHTLCKHFCPPDPEDLFGLEPDPEKTFHVLTLEEYRAFRKRGAAPLVLKADGFSLRLEKGAYPPDVFDELTRIMARLMRFELRLFEE